VSAAHGSTVDRGQGVPPRFDQDRPCQIKRPGTCASRVRRRARRSVAARGRGSPALPLGGVPGHHSVHEPVQNEARALAHVTGESRGAIVPRRRPAPEGGGAGAPMSSWKRQNAQNRKVSSRGFCSPRVEEEGELKKHREDAGEGTWKRRRIRRRSGVVGARLPRASGTGTCSSTCLISPWQS
jgi:hypothetical protein